MSAEPVAERVCDMAATIYDRALSLPGVKEVLKDQDELRHNSVFNSVSKMGLINWSFRLIAAFSLAGILGNDNEVASLRALQGRTRNCHGFGTIDILCFKFKLAKHLLIKWAPFARLEAKALKSMEAIIYDPLHVACKVRLAKQEGPPRPDLARHWG